MEVKLIGYTPVPEYTCEAGAAKCVGRKPSMAALKHALQSGHDSVAEHCAFTFEINGISRVTLAQLTRHRIASFSVESERYVNLLANAFVMPETVRQSRFADEYMDFMDTAKELYTQMVDEGIPMEDARYCIPQSIVTGLIMTMNARELRHFFSLRCCNRAQWEIRELAMEMLRIVRDISPVLFEDAGPECNRTGCRERMSCGKPWK